MLQLTRSSAVAERLRALRVVEYFARINRNDTVEYGVCKSLLLKMSVSRTVSETFNTK